jgi:hypothetical protein
MDNVFQHPEGLLTARNLVRLVISGLTPAMPDSLHHVLTFSDSHIQPFSTDTMRPPYHPSTTPPSHSTDESLLLEPQPHNTARLCHEQSTVMSAKKPASKKRESDAGEEPAKKRPRSKDAAKPKKTSKPKAKRKVPVCINLSFPPAIQHFPSTSFLIIIDLQAKYRLDDTIWMRILEFTPVQFLGKARLISKNIKTMVDEYTSIYINCRKENYGYDMPPPPFCLTERQYSNLLRGRGCLEPGCNDKNAARTHWSWAKRWCTKCWKSKIEREDRLIKSRADLLPRTIFVKLLQCIPVGMHDSFMKPHDYVDVDDSRPLTAPRLYKYYLTEEVDKIVQRYEDLTPPPFHADPNKTAAENAAALIHHQEELDGLVEKQSDFLATEKAKIDEHMAMVQRIEAAVAARREKLRAPNDAARNARKALFTRRAKEDLPHIPEDFVTSSTSFKAATRIFRNGGTERGWQKLKPKIEKEYAERLRTQAISPAQLDGAEDEMDIDSDQTTPPPSNIAKSVGTAKDAELNMHNMGRLPRMASVPSQLDSAEDEMDIDIDQTTPPPGNIAKSVGPAKDAELNIHNMGQLPRRASVLSQLDGAADDAEPLKDADFDDMFMAASASNSMRGCNVFTSQANYSLSKGMVDRKSSTPQTNSNLSKGPSHWTHNSSSQTNPNPSNRMNSRTHINNSPAHHNPSNATNDWNHINSSRSNVTSSNTMSNKESHVRQQKGKNLDRHNVVPRWPRALPPTSSLSLGPIFPGVIPATGAPPSHGFTGTHISISSLVHPYDQ